MAIEGIRLGPFIGGLNIASDPASIGDSDVAVLENLELDLDGALVSRPPINHIQPNIPVVSGQPDQLKLIGHYVTPQGASYLIAHNGNATYYRSGSLWHKICDFPAADIAQYRDRLWLVSPVGHPEGSGGWDLATNFQTVATMPHGATIVAHKERLWIGLGEDATENGSRIYYSEVGQPNVWPGGGDYFNVSAGDGENVVAMFLYYNDLLIFKTRSTYRFSYSSSPETGVVSKVSETVGAASRDSVVAHENSLYVVFGTKVYEVSNYNFNQINHKVPLVSSSYDQTLLYRVTISAWNDRLIVNYFGTTYVYSLRTSTWSTWTSVHAVIGKVEPQPVTYSNQRPGAYIAGAPRGSRWLYQIDEDLNVERNEPIECTVVTKNYDYQSAHTFKRLSWWGADLITRGRIEATVTPIVHAPGVTWAQTRPRTWEQLQSWNRPLDVEITVTDPLVSEESTGYRKFIKLLKSLRFRQINFRLKFFVDGTPLTSPAKLFTLTTFVGVKERVSQKVS